MDSFEYRNVYNQDYFELYTDKRDRSFRFARYNGCNYKTLCEYIKEKSPYTEIWDEDDLKKGYLYTISGSRYFSGQFKEILPHNVRCCIASNPYIYVEDDRKKLYLSSEEAIEYLLKADGNKIFRYGEIESTYIYDRKDGKFYKINKQHPHGIDVTKSEIERHKEWYIVGDDAIQTIDCSPSYDHAMHCVSFEYNLREKADLIVDLIYKINKASYEAKNTIIFNQTWEDVHRYRLLYKKCLYESDFKEFVNTLYLYIYEETKNYPKPREEGGGKRTLENLPMQFRNEKFPTIVEKWRKFYFPGNAEFHLNHNNGMQEIFLSYVGREKRPQQPNDFEKVQNQLLQEFHGYLKDLRKSIEQNIPRRGIIEIDDYNNVHCQDVLLNRSLEKFLGCSCFIRRLMENEKRTKKYYPHYCPSPEYIQIDHDGIIAESENQLRCNDIIIHESLKSYIGKEIKIKKIEIIKTADNIDMLQAYEFDVLINPVIKDVIREEKEHFFVSRWELPADKGKYSDGSRVELSAIHIKKHGKAFEETPEIHVIETPQRDERSVAYDQLCEKIFPQEKDKQRFQELMGALIEADFLKKTSHGKLTIGTEGNKKYLGYVVKAIEQNLGIKQNELTILICKETNKDDTKYTDYSDNDLRTAVSEGKKMAQSECQGKTKKRKECLDSILTKYVFVLPQY